MNEQKDYIVFSMRLAGYLMQRGIRIRKIKPSKENPHKHVYIFPDTEQTRIYIKEYQSNCNK